MIQVKELHKSFNSKQVLRGVNLEIPSGQAVTIIGQSGSGKSVLLKHLVGLLEPDSGEVYIDNILITNIEARPVTTTPTTGTIHRTVANGGTAVIAGITETDDGRLRC